MKQLLKGAAVIGVASTFALASSLGSPQIASAVTTCPTDLFSSRTPGNPNYNDPASINVGVEFDPNDAPFVRGVKFYKGVDNTGTHIAYLRDKTTSTTLASATYTSETSSGWQSVDFGSDIQVDGSHSYLVWVSMPNGHYAVNTGGVDSFAVNQGSSVDPIQITAGNKGYYSYTSTPSAVPSNAVNFNYWVSPVVGDSTAPASVTGLTAVDDAAGPIVDWTGAATDTNSEGTVYATQTDIYRSDGVTNQRIGRVDGKGATSWLDAFSNQQHDVTAAPGTTYTYSALATDACGNTDSVAATSMTTASQSLEHVFNGPFGFADTDTTPSVFGMHWQTAVDGKVWGARILRDENTAPGPLNHLVANLWDNNGTLLATQLVPRANNQSGWIDVRFDTPVSVSANHDYVIGYYSPNGQEVFANTMFASSVVNGNLTARADSSITPNGVYAQGGSLTATTFPTTRSSNGTAYGVDVSFYEN